jgi:hypothetical protein
MERNFIAATGYISYHSFSYICFRLLLTNSVCVCAIDYLRVIALRSGALDVVYQRILISLPF